MKKLLPVFTGIMFSSMVSFAQYWQIPNPNANTNPGGLNTDAEYPVGGGLAATWTTFHSPSASPAWSPNQTLPFNFSFNGSTVTSFKVSNSGVLTFDVATAIPAPSFTRAALPNASIPDNSVCIWGLGGIGTNDNVVKNIFGTAPNRQLWIQFSSYGYGTVASDGTNYCYWSIVLEETTNRIHIVDQRSNGFAGTAKVSAGVQVNSSSAFSVATSPDLEPLAGFDATPIDNSYYTFVPGTQPAFDLAVTAITTSPYLSQGNVTITGTITNYGTTTITSMDLNYKIDGGAAVTSNLTGLSIASFSTYSFSHPTPWNAVIGNHTIQAYASNLNNGNVDANPGDDALTKTVAVMSELVTRLPLFEIFTSSTCGPCAPGNTNYHSIVDPRPASEYVSIKYQQDFPGTGDPYATTESVNRRSSYYAINSIPRMMIDGGWNSNATSFTNALYDDAILKPAQFKLNGTWSITGTTINCKVRFSPLFNSTGAKVRVAILEGTTFDNVKTNGETEFEHVMKKMLPNETGSNVPTVAIGAWDSLSLSYTFPGSYRLPADGTSANRINTATEHSVEEFTDLYVIAWVQGSDKTVFQAANLTKVTSTGIESLSQAINSVEVFPNPSAEVINVTINMDNTDGIAATLVDIEGSIVDSKVLRLNTGKNTIQFNAANLANGVYNVMVFDSKNNSSVHKIIVQH
jgi:hypothetical protein